MELPAESQLITHNPFSCRCCVCCCVCCCTSTSTHHAPPPCLFLQHIRLFSTYEYIVPDLLARAHTYTVQGDFSMADEVASKFMRRHRNLPETRVLEAMFAYYEEAKLDKAADLLRSVLQDVKTHTKATDLLARISRIDTLKKGAEYAHLRKNYTEAIFGST
jgi:hypothetical protein